MTNTPFSKKCEILRDFQEVAFNKDWAQAYLFEHDLGVPFAIGAADGMLTLNDTGKEYVSNSFDALCDLLGVDKYGDFDSLDELLEIYNEQG